MTEYNVQQSQQEYFNQITALKNNGFELNESQQAILFTKILVKKAKAPNVNIVFCNDNEIFVSKTPTGYDVVGYYVVPSGTKMPFSITICKVNDTWYLSKKYVAADTKSCSGSILLWVLLSLGCTLMGILMYFLISAAIGI